MTRDELLDISREPNVAAFLRVIRACEGTASDAGYRMLFGGGLVNDFRDHPRILISLSGLKSTAAGAYQFLERTWDGLRQQYGFPDFSPDSQDAAAVALLIRRGALEDIRAGRLEAAVEKCNKEWASLPGSPYGQPVKTMDFVRREYAKHLPRESTPVSAGSEPVSPGKSTGNQPSKPMAPVVAALLPSLISLIPELGKLFGSGSAVSDRNIAAAQKVAETVVQAVGAPNLQGAVETMSGDPEARRKASEAVQGIWYELVEVGGGIAAARTFNVQTASIPAWRMPAVWVSGALLALVFMVVGSVLWGNGWSNDIRLQVVTAVLTIIGMVGSFWLGTSASSQRKTDILAEK